MDFRTAKEAYTEAGVKCSREDPRFANASTEQRYAMIAARLSTEVLEFELSTDPGELEYRYLKACHREIERRQDNTWWT